MSSLRFCICFLHRRLQRFDQVESVIIGPHPFPRSLGQALLKEGEINSALSAALEGERTRRIDCFFATTPGIRLAYDKRDGTHRPDFVQEASCR
jgi:hypothetical protein